MFSKKNPVPQPIKVEEPSRNPFTKIANKVFTKITTSELKEFVEKEKPVKLITSEPNLEPIYESHNAKQQNSKKQKDRPRFMRSSSNNKPNVIFKFLSPPHKKNPLVHQPVIPKKVEQQKPFRTQVIPPSDLAHDKMKNFDQNPERFFVNVDQGLDKVFKKSIESIIKTAKVIPVKDWEIRDSTNLLDGFTGEQ